jgi:DNA-binding PadR family transcriptional regulator
MRRGDIRTSLLVTLSEQPGHGYEVIQTIEAKSGGAWKPSPGSVYPTLQMLEDEGLLSSTERDGKRVYEITDAGRAEAETRTAEAGGAPWEVAGGLGGTGHGELKRAMVQLHLATKQVAITGDTDLAEKAVAIVKDARKQLYQLLADA